MHIWEHAFWGNSVAAWAIAAGIFLLSLIALGILKRILAKRLAGLSERTATHVDDLIVGLLQGTRRFFTFTLAAWLASFALVIPEDLKSSLGIVAIIAVLVQIGFWGSAAIRYFVQREVSRQLEVQDPGSATALNALGFIGQLVLWAVLLLLALDNAGVEISTLVASLGIGGIAVALAIQNILGDLFAALSIVIDKPFAIGDFIIVNDFMGSVERIGLKSTRIRSLTGEELIFSNSDLLNSRIRNYKSLHRRRIVFTLGIAYGTPHAKVAAVPGMIREIIDAQEKATLDRAHFKTYGDFSLNFEVVYYVEDADYTLYMDIQQAINLALYAKFAEEHIEFAFPTQTVFVKGSEQASSQVVSE